MGDEQIEYLLEYYDQVQSSGFNAPIKSTKPAPEPLAIVKPPRRKWMAEKTCHVCNKTFSKTYSLVRHLALHTGERPFKCNQCPFEFIQKSDLQRHLATHIDEKRVICKFKGCGLAFKTKRNMRSHQSNKHSGRKKTHRCIECNKMFAFHCMLKAHLKAMHSLASFICDYCGKDLKFKFDIRRHVRLHRDIKRLRPVHRQHAGLEILLDEDEDTESATESEDRFEIEAVTEVKMEEGEEMAVKFEPYPMHDFRQTKEDLDMKFLRSFIPQMKRMNHKEKEIFKRNVRLMICKVLEM